MKSSMLIVVLSILASSIFFSQNPEWINYTNGQFVFSIVIEDDYLWTGTNGGLVKLNTNTGETIHISKASGLPGNWINSIAIDGNGTKWIGTKDGGLAKFDGTNWTFYNNSNSGLPNNAINFLTIDENGSKWIGTTGGLAKFDGTNWTVYNTSKSDLPSNTIHYLPIDESGNKWIGTSGGLTVYNEGGVDSVEKKNTTLSKKLLLHQNYPYPFNPNTTIKYSIPKQSRVTLKVSDLLGREVTTLVNKEQLKGNYEVEFDGTDLTS